MMAFYDSSNEIEKFVIIEKTKYDKMNQIFKIILLELMTWWIKKLNTITKLKKGKT